MNGSQKEKEMLYEVALQFRKAIEQIIKEKNIPNGLNPIFGNFPKWACGNTSELLAYYFMEEKGISVLINTGGRYKEKDKTYSHEWIEYEKKYIIDITSDQFEGRKDQSVVVTDKNDVWYKKFKEGTTITFNGEFSRCFKSDLLAFYKMIVDKIDSCS